MDRVCDNCKREPDQFKTDKDDIGYFFVVPKDGDPVFLMSNLEFSFKVCIDRNPPDDKENDYLCFNCIESITKEK